MSTSPYHHGNLASALEAAALRLLEEKPAADISLREVARAADVSHNAPYHHFEDRRGLLKVLAERSMAMLLDDVSRAVAAHDDVKERVLHGGLAYIRFALEHPFAFDAVYDPTVCIPGQPTATMAPLIAGLEEVLAQAAAAAGLEGDAEVTGLWGLVHGLATLAAAGHFSDDDAREAYEALLSRMLPR